LAEVCNGPTINTNKINDFIDAQVDFLHKAEDIKVCFAVASTAKAFLIEAQLLQGFLQVT
jgi:hypothetical protein